MGNRSDRPLSIAVIGCGAFGRNHARVYHELEKAGEPMRLAAVVDTNASRVEALAREFNCAGYPTLDALLSSATIDAASVAVPTVDHAAVARELMQAGVDILVEKPVTPTLVEADALIQVASREGRIAQVGHLERFNPAVQATLPLITKPMFFEVHRLSVFTPRSLDVDVVLDLMIHDLDAVLALVRSPVKEIRAAGLPILSNKVDIANAHRIRIRLRRQFDRQPRLDRTGAQVALLPAPTVHFDRLRPPGRAHFHRGRYERHTLAERRH